MTYQPDEIDLKILSQLLKNSQQSIKLIAQTVGLSVTPVYERIKRLEQRGIIKNYSINLDREKLGWELTVFCNVSLQTHTKNLIEQFEEAVKKMTEVIEVYHISGDFDYMLKVVCKDNKQYHDFLIQKLSKLNMVAKVQSNFVMLEVKSNHFLTELN